MKRPNSRSERLAARNRQYLERKKKMVGPIIDPMGFPVGGNSQPHQPQINPVLHMLWPVFVQSIHDLLVQDNDANRPTRAHQDTVDGAWEIANRAIEKMGFKYVFPMSVAVMSPADLLPSKEEARSYE